MKTYEVAITITDVTSVDAHSEEEALAIAEEVFNENGLLIGNYKFDIIETRQYDGE